MSALYVVTVPQQLYSVKVFVGYNFGIMLKCLLVFLLFASAVPTMTAQDEPSRKQTTDESNGQSKPTTPLEAQNETTHYREQEASDKPKGWHKLIAWPEGITAWLIMFTLAAIVWQAWETRKAASAASDQSRHIVSSERAWLIAALENTPIPLDGPYAFAGIPKLTNYGSTPAFIVEIGNTVVILDKDETLPNEGLPIKGRNIAIFEGRGIAVAPKGEVGRPIVSIETAPAANVLSGQSVVWVYGYAKYRTAFSDDLCETRYCFRLIPAMLDVLPNSFVMDGPPSYNQAT